MLLSNGFRPDVRVLKEAESLAHLGYTVTILCWDRTAEFPPEETLPSGVHIIRIHNVPSTYGIGAAQLLRLPRFWLAALPHLTRLRPDLIHCHDFDTLPAGLWWGKTHGIPVIYDAHEYYADLCKPRLHGIAGALLYRTIRLAEHWGARLASAIVTVDETLGNIYRHDNPRVVILGHYPPRELAAEPNPVFTRPELTLFYAGRLSVDRGLLVYADMLRHLRENRIPARLKLAGVFTLIHDETLFRERIRGLEDSVEILGWVPYGEMPAILRAADIGLAVLLPEPRYVAALPVKLFEYMAAGLPVLASDFPAIREIVTSKDCGALINPLDNPRQSAEILRDWWQHPERARALGENGRQGVLRAYNWELLVKRLEELNRSTLQSPKRVDGGLD